MEMNELRRAIVRSAIHKGIEDIQQDPERGVRKLVDLGSHFSKGRFQRFIFGVMQKELVNPQSAYYALVTQLAQNVRAENLEQFGLNTGYNSWTHGAQIIRAHEHEHGYNVPWCLVLDATQEIRFDLDGLLRQGEALGIYSYFLFTGDGAQTAALLPVLKQHKDSMAAVLLRDAELPPVNIENVGNIMVLPRADAPDAALAAQELLARKCLYGLWQHYTPQNVENILSGSLEKTAQAWKAPLVLAVPEQDCPPETRALVRDYAQQTREEKKTPAFLADFFTSIEEIDRVISVESCMLGVNWDGTVFTAQGRNDKINVESIALEDVLLCTMPRVTYETQKGE